MKKTANNSKAQTPYMITKDNIIIEVNSAFLELTGYNLNDILQKSFSFVIDMLRISSEKPYEICETPINCFIFSKNHEAIEVELSIEDMPLMKEKVYKFNNTKMFKINDKFAYLIHLCNENINSIAIYSYYDFKLLRANQLYLDFFTSPYNTSNFSFGKNFSELVSHTEDIFLKNCDLQTMFSNTSEQNKSILFNEKQRFHTNLGETIWNVEYYPIQYKGKIRYILETSTNVTNKAVTDRILKEQSNTIEKQKIQLKAIIDNLPDAIQIIDKNGLHYLSNNAAKRLFHGELFELEETFYNQGTYSDLKGNKLKKDAMPVARMLKGEKLTSEIIKIENKYLNEYLSVSATPIFNSSCEFEFGIISSRIVTEMIEREKYIKKHHDMLYSILNTLDFPVGRISYPDFRIEEINKKAFEFLYKYAPGKLSELKADSEKQIKSLFPEFLLTNSYKQIKSMFKSKTSTYLKESKVIFGSDELYLTTIFQPIIERNGEIKEFLIIINDVTEQVAKKHEIEKILHMQNEFFSFISHEFRTPLTTISSSIQFMEVVCKNEMTPKIKKYLNMIKRNTFQQLRLVNSLLDITRAEAGYLKIYKRNFDIIALTKAIIDSIDSFAKAKHINISFESPLTERYIAVDDEKYERIILNLLSNAIKFTPEGKNIFVSISLSKNTILVEVKDTGPGIPKEKQNIIFDRFGQVNNNLTRQSEGSGIGLCLAKLLVNAMKGDILLHSKEGQGSSFVVVLPDETINNTEELILPELTNNRLVQSMKTEFSNIYVDNIQ